MKFNKLICILLIIFEFFGEINDFSAALTMDKMEVVGRDNENMDVERNLSISDTKKLRKMFYMGGDGNTKN